jgi:hypothetical protein
MTHGSCIQADRPPRGAAQLVYAQGRMQELGNGGVGRVSLGARTVIGPTAAITRH